MKTIRKRLILLAVWSWVGLLAFVIIILQYITGREFSYWSLTPALAGVVLLSIYLINAYRSYQAARLIIDNEIMRIKSAVIEEASLTSEDYTSQIEGAEVIISCFGVLLGSQVIKFNIDKIILQRVEIGRQFICLTYGKAEWKRRLRILHNVNDYQELQSYVERFRYETGVVPVTMDL